MNKWITLTVEYKGKIDILKSEICAVKEYEPNGSILTYVYLKSKEIFSVNESKAEIMSKLLTNILVDEK